MDTLSLFAAEAATGLSLGVRVPLSLMNFLEFAVWGAWFVVLGQYLHGLNFSGKDIGRIYATIPLGAIISPIFVGSIADRYFASEWLMVVLHGCGAGLLFWMAHIKTPRKFFWVTLAYALVYSPTLSLSNAIVFANVPNSNWDFPTIRVLGTIGWIAANLYLKVLLKPGEPVNNRPLLLASVLSAGLALASVALPHTPPKATTGTNPWLRVVEGFGRGDVSSGYAALREGVPFLQAIDLLTEPSFAVFFGISFLITIALAFYFSFTSLYLEQKVRVRPENVGPLMTIGQWVEIPFMLSLSWFLDHWGMKTVLIIGMAAWGLRYLTFTLGKPFPLVILGLALHGLCFDFFFGAGFIYVDNTAPEAIRASGQGLFGALTYGLGMYIGTEASGWLNHRLTKEVVDPVTKQTVKVTDWRTFWLIPCIGAVASLILFIAMFR